MHSVLQPAVSPRVPWVPAFTSRVVYTRGRKKLRHVAVFRVLNLQLTPDAELPSHNDYQFRYVLYV